MFLARDSVFSSKGLIPFVNINHLPVGNTQDTKQPLNLTLHLFSKKISQIKESVLQFLTSFGASVSAVANRDGAVASIFPRHARLTNPEVSFPQSIMTLQHPTSVYKPNLPEKQTNRNKMLTLVHFLSTNMEEMELMSYPAASHHRAMPDDLSSLKGQWHVVHLHISYCQWSDYVKKLYVFTYGITPWGYKENIRLQIMA